MKYCKLTEKIISLVDLLNEGEPIDLSRQIEEIVSNHGLNKDTPKWMISVIDDIINQKVSEKLLLIPRGYPKGENGLGNILLDIDEIFELKGFHDYGEGTEWEIEKLGIAYIVILEMRNPEFAGVAIRPLESDISGWLRKEYEKL